jgi:predicted nucleotidyltransferase
MKSLIEYITESSKNRRVGGTSFLEQDLYDCLRCDIEELLDEAYLQDDVNVIELWAHGSRMRGDFRPDSDIDVVVFYDGKIREDALFDILNYGHERGTIEGHIVDLNPVKVRNQSDINKYKQKSDKYDKEKLASNGN